MAFVPQNINDFRNRMAGLSIIPSAINGAVDTLGAAFNSRKQLEAQRYKDYLDALYKLRELQARGQGGEKDKGIKLDYMSYDDYKKDLMKRAAADLKGSDKEAQAFAATTNENMRKGMYAKANAPKMIDMFTQAFGKHEINNLPEFMSDLNAGLQNLDPKDVGDLYTDNYTSMKALQDLTPKVSQYLKQTGTVGNQAGSRLEQLMALGQQAATDKYYGEHSGNLKNLLQGVEQTQPGLVGQLKEKLRATLYGQGKAVPVDLPFSKAPKMGVPDYYRVLQANDAGDLRSQGSSLLTAGNEFFRKNMSPDQLAQMHPFQAAALQKLYSDVNRYKGMTLDQIVNN